MVNSCHRIRQAASYQRHDPCVRHPHVLVVIAALARVKGASSIRTYQLVTRGVLMLQAMPSKAQYDG
jgi:hypothetical protein